MWIIFACGSAFFAGITAVLAKCGIKNIDSDVATAIRTMIVLIFSWILVFISRDINGIFFIDSKTLVFLILSGIATGASWLCYFKALQEGDINKVTPIDKSSTVLTMIFACIFLGESMNILKIMSILFIGSGTYLMITKKKIKKKESISSSWIIYAIMSAAFASLTSILGKVGIENVNSNLGTAIRTIVVLIMAWLVVIIKGKINTIKNIDKNSWIFLIFSGIATGVSWLCYYRALQTGPASVVVPIDKLSILITIIFSYIAFKEKLTPKSAMGLVLIVLGTFMLLIK